MTATLDHRRLHRLPWSLPDNAISWLEPTAACNLYCEGCYRTNDPKSHKSLGDVARDLDVFTRWRTSDGISVAGGDPLTHPRVAEIVAMIVARGYKPILNLPRHDGVEGSPGVVVPTGGADAVWRVCTDGSPIPAAGADPRSTVVRPLP
ncbi:MAG: radical SAM protein, partial [Gemmatimonadetes bacterium]|nr:radical SAM protein [Gemmatimonadota bacterium]